MLVHLNNKGVALDDLGRHEEAIEYYDRLLAIDPTEVNALNNKGVALAELGKYQEAIEYFDKALAIDPNDVYSLNNKANSLASLAESIEEVLFRTITITMIIIKYFQ